MSLVVPGASEQSFPYHIPTRMGSMEMMVRDPTSIDSQEDPSSQS